MTNTTITLPTPHLSKLNKLGTNLRLPKSDRKPVDNAIKMYEQWIAELESIPIGKTGTVSKLVDATNRYKRFIELNLIFDSTDDFLYRQKGQLKLDNTILEEFLPQLLHRSLKGIEKTFALGPAKTFSGLCFTSTIGNIGKGGAPQVRVKNQDFILGKPLYIKTSFDLISDTP